jgi:general secretion pathway protein I
MRHRRQGLTLIEVLVAFVIAALAMGVLFSVAGNDLRAVEIAGRYQEALSRARSHLAAIGVGGPLAPGTQQGEDVGGFRWQVQIVELAVGVVSPPSSAAPLSAGQAPALYQVSIAESWTDGTHVRVVRLSTERVGAAPTSRP